MIVEMDLAANVLELDLSGFVFDKHQMAFETLDSKIAKGIMKLIPTELKRRINFLGDSVQEQMFNANRQANHVSIIIFFSTVTKTQGAYFELE